MRRQLAIVLALAMPCIGRAQPTHDGRFPLEIEYGGCSELVHGACAMRADGELRLWVRTMVDARVEIRHGRSVVRPDSGVAVQGGLRYEFAVQPDDALVTVHVTRADAAASWSLPLVSYQRSDVAQRAAELMAKDDLAHARTLLEALDTPDGDALGLLGRIRNLQGETEAAQVTLRAAIARNLADGGELAAVTDATVLAYALMVKGRQFSAARAELDRFDDGPGASAEQRYYLAYFRGLLAYNSGDDRGTLRQLGVAADEAARMGWDRLQLTAEQMLAVQLQMLGRRAEASAMIAAWQARLELLASDCERAMFLNNVGWTRLLALEAGEPTEDPLPALEQAYATISSPAAGGLCNADEQVNVLINLALAHLHAGRLDQAALHLERARQVTSTPELRMLLWSLDIEARLALARGDAQASLAQAGRLRELGDATASPDAVWRAVIRTALAYQQLDRVDDALGAFAEAEHLLDESLFRVPVNEGRETLVASHAWATRQYVALLLQQGRTDEALAVARRADARALQSLRPAALIAAFDGDARERWDATMARYLELRDELTGLTRLGWVLPRDELERIEALHAQRDRELDVVLDDALAALGPAYYASASARASGTLEVAFQRLPDAWVTFAAGVEGVTAYVGCGRESDAIGLARCLLEPVVAAAARAERVRLLVPDELRDVDFHAVTVDGDVLLARAPISYGLNLPALAAAPRERRALVVGDTLGNLSAAQEEIRVVRDSLDAAPTDWHVTLLRGDDAELERVRPALATADLFHYAGHARRLGARGWDSEIELGRRTSLDVSDILTLERAPDFVILSGCETAATDAAGESGGIGLAQAFVASGARTVLATSRPVRDSAALALVKSFYGAWLAGAPPEVALQRAQLTLRHDTVTEDWSAFRLIER
jgi:hypothetical protein